MRASAFRFAGGNSYLKLRFGILRSGLCATGRTIVALRERERGRRRTATTAADAATCPAASKSAQVAEFSGRCPRSLLQATKGWGFPRRVAARGKAAKEPRALLRGACGSIAEGDSAATAARGTRLWGVHGSPNAAGARAQNSTLTPAYTFRSFELSSEGSTYESYSSRMPAVPLRSPFGDSAIS